MLFTAHNVYKFHTERETPRYVSLGEDSSCGIGCGRETSSQEEE